MDQPKALDELKIKFSEMSEQVRNLQRKLEESENDHKKQNSYHDACTYGDEAQSPLWYEENAMIINKYLNRVGRNLSSQAISTCQKYAQKDINTFDGTITLGDMTFIAIFIEMLKPKKIYEIGVASGFSSAFLLNLGLELDLIQPESIFLHSYDLLYLHSKNKNDRDNIIGEVVEKYFPELIRYWDLNINTTSFDIELQGSDKESALFFIDGGHEHPWPLIDIINIFEKTRDDKTWILLHDNRVIERWYQDSRKYNTEMLTPVRGVEMAFIYWPGQKVSGKNGCYNMCAINLDVSEKMFAEFVKNTVNYWPNLTPENNYGCAKFREAMKRKMGNYEEVIKTKIAKYL